MVQLLSDGDVEFGHWKCHYALGFLDAAHNIRGKPWRKKCNEAMDIVRRYGNGRGITI